MKSKRTVVWTCLALAVSAGSAFAAANALVVEDGALARTVAAAAANDERSVTLPKGTYRLKGNGGSFFSLSGVKDFTVDFSGAHLIALKPHRMFSLVCCTNVTVKNVSFD